MRGISEEMPNKCYDSALRMDDKIAIPGLEIAMVMCTELNQWQPIDENTPKDRDLILLFEDIGAIQGKWSEFCLSHVPNELIYFKNRPTHWLALPSDPLSLPMPPAEAPDSEPHTPSADVSPKVSKHG